MRLPSLLTATRTAGTQLPGHQARGASGHVSGLLCVLAWRAAPLPACRLPVCDAAASVAAPGASPRSPPSVEAPGASPRSPLLNHAAPLLQQVAQRAADADRCRQAGRRGEYRLALENSLRVLRALRQVIGCNSALSAAPPPAATKRKASWHRPYAQAGMLVLLSPGRRAFPSRRLTRTCLRSSAWGRLPGESGRWGAAERGTVGGKEEWRRCGLKWRPSPASREA